jgi:hypothetical protein
MTISERLTQLNCDAIEEGGSINPISLSSFLHFTELLGEHVRDSLVLSLTPENEIYAIWEGSKKHCLRFSEDGNIKYFYFFIVGKK